MSAGSTPWNGSDMGHLSDSGVDAFGGREPGPGGGLDVPQLGEVVARQVQVLVRAERALERGPGGGCGRGARRRCRAPSGAPWRRRSRRASAGRAACRSARKRSTISSSLLAHQRRGGLRAREQHQAPAGPARAAARSACAWLVNMSKTRPGWPWRRRRRRASRSSRSSRPPRSGTRRRSAATARRRPARPRARRAAPRAAPVRRRSRGARSPRRRRGARPGRSPSGRWRRTRQPVRARSPSSRPSAAGQPAASRRSRLRAISEPLPPQTSANSPIPQPADSSSQLRGGAVRRAREDLVARRAAAGRGTRRTCGRPRSRSGARAGGSGRRRAGPSGPPWRTRSGRAPTAAAGTGRSRRARR